MFKINFDWRATIDPFGRSIWYNTKTGEINWRSQIDTHRHGDGVLCCSGGHKLTAHTVALKGWSCDNCGKRQSELTEMMGCRICNTDVCKKCYPNIVSKTVMPEIPKMFIPSPLQIMTYDTLPIIQKQIRGHLVKKRFRKLINARQIKIKTLQLNLARVSDGETPLIKAVRNNNIDITKALISAGADVNATDIKNNETPLFIAIEKQTIELIKILIKAGANLGHVNKKGETVLLKACCLDNKEIVDIILKS